MQTDQPDRMLIADNVQVLRQGLELLGRLDDLRYVSLNPPLFSYGIGSHFRHCLDSFQCFLNGVMTGRIDYDERERDVLTDADRFRAMARIELTIERLEALAFADARHHLQSRQDSLYWTDSSVRRELQFLLSHTIHHYALIALMLRLQGFEPPANFGVAPSTLDYWKREEQKEEALTAQ
jgi:uncharacterized damage-inducible protein DinB